MNMLGMSNGTGTAGISNGEYALQVITFDKHLA